MSTRVARRLKVLRAGVETTHVRPSVVIRLELSDSGQPRITMREDSEGAVAYLTLAFAQGQVSLCIRHPRQARQLQEALSKAIAELQEVAAFTM